MGKLFKWPTTAIDWLGRIELAWRITLLIGGLIGPGLAYMAYIFGLNPPLSIMAGVAFTALILMGIVAIRSWTVDLRKKIGGPLQIIFDSGNPGKKFWSLEVERNENGETSKPYWQYRAEIKICRVERSVAFGFLQNRLG